MAKGDPLGPDYQPPGERLGHRYSSRPLPDFNQSDCTYSVQVRQPLHSYIQRTKAWQV